MRIHLYALQLEYPSNSWRQSASSYEQQKHAYQAKRIKCFVKFKLIILQYVISFFVVLLGFTTFAHALPDNKTQPIHVQAGSAELTQKEGKTVYRGGVQFDQGNSHLRAAEATTLHNQQNELINAVAKGNHEEQAYFWTIVEEGKPEMHARADVIEFLPKERKILLIGNAEVTQGNDRFSAPRIEYDIAKRHVLSKSDSKTKGKTTIFIRLKDH